MTISLEQLAKVVRCLVDDFTPRNKEVKDYLDGFKKEMDSHAVTKPAAGSKVTELKEPKVSK